jgi:hypothetical protein
LHDQVIYRHLAGQQIVGLYPLLHDNTCYLLVADFDKGSWQDEVKAMSRACNEYGVPHAVEISRSGNGAYLWIFFDDKVPANAARLLGFGLLDKAMEVYLRVNAMLIEQINILGSETFERSLSDLPDVFRPAVENIKPLLGIKAEFGGNHHLIPYPLQRLTYHLLIGVRPVNFRCIKERHTAIDRCA